MCSDGRFLQAWSQFISHRVFVTIALVDNWNPQSPLFSNNIEFLKRASKSGGAQAPPSELPLVDMSVESCAYLCYNIYVTFSVVEYSIAHKYPRILMLQVKYYVARSYHIGLTSQKLRKIRDSRNINHNAINLQALAHAGSLEFDSIHIGWSFIARFKILVLIVYSEF